ncbi:P-loop containing nucleoside triphosphate hydrolase protein [Catenaria anguillulae PL171]|uniref:p-loop containing nucleoside triphosphate hydrolase protein n=1 Tax=Catenaria anguillulae PL171 TaxID=765915 RepID=A0A1Y2H4A2_9FUNG|nr:P-loop containing nucleoside triphosphate hydrolase protein [Catenaria anguillulae PL171]ORZ38854.1 P-loop containing nucleoside triphosphate hydrolase protein [Catenaria anguillulae PL171]
MLTTAAPAAPTNTDSRSNAAFLGGLDNKKILVVGSPRSGKSCLVSRYVSDSYPTETNGTVPYHQTLGADLVIKHIVDGENRLALSLWCLGGHQRYRSTLSQLFTDDVSAVLVAVDLLSSKSLDDAIEWMSQAKEMCPTALLYLCGTKADEVDKIAFKMPDLTRSARDAGAIAFKPTSAKTGAGVKDIFEDIVAKLREL